MQKIIDAEKSDLFDVLAYVTYWGTADLVNGNGPQRGYFVDVHANGDRNIGTFEGKVKTAGGQVMIEGTWKYSDGTEQFEGLTGGGTYKGRMSSSHFSPGFAPQVGHRTDRAVFFRSIVA